MFVYITRNDIVWCFVIFNIDNEFASQYLLFSTSISCKFCIIEMRLINSTISSNHIYIICCKTLITTIAWSHYIKNIVLKFLKMRFENLITFLFENSNLSLIRTNSNCLILFIYWSRILSIFRSITRSINILIIKSFYVIEFWENYHYNYSFQHVLYLFLYIILNECHWWSLKIFNKL